MASANTPPEPPPDYDAAAAPHGLPRRQPSPGRKGPLPLALPILSYLRSRRVILASASPRRRVLLAQIGLTNLEILPCAEPEDLSKEDLGPDGYVTATAMRKCLSVYRAALAAQEAAAATAAAATAAAATAAAASPSALVAPPDDPAVVIAADTVIVTTDGAVLEKPRSAADHARMLRKLRDDGAHRVLTAVCCLAPRADARHPGYELAAHVEETRVVFAGAADGLTNDVIDAYVRTREGVDKAGGYAVQGIAGSLLVERVEGSVDNVVGLPVRRCLQLCEKVVFWQGAYGEEEDRKEEVDDDEEEGGGGG